MNGADRLCDVLLANGIDVTFANPGTSEMHFVAALDRKPAMRCVLGLFEGVATGAADGYARMAGKPAAVLLHTGPGLANGLANLHNARRAHTPIVTVVGDHASHHLAFDAPLTTDIESLARPMSHWVGRASGPESVGATAEAAIRAAETGRGVSTMILPADSAWGPVEAAPVVPIAWPVPPLPEAATIERVAAALRAHGTRAGVVLAGRASYGVALETAGRIAAATGARLFGEVLSARTARGRGRVPLERIPYPIDQALAALKDLDVMILVGGQEPVAFFAYPGKPSRILPETCRVETLAAVGEDEAGALAALAEALDAPAQAAVIPVSAPPAPIDDLAGPLTDDAITRIVAALLPDNAILADEGLTSGRSFWSLSASAAPHDYLMIPGGAIGNGIPMATGAAIACPDRKVVALQADGSAMYTVQGLWTQAREGLDVVTVIYSNRAYAILRLEMQNVGAGHFGRNAERMLNIDAPALDWVSLARGMGVEAARAETAAAFRDLFKAALGRRGPFLIEAVI